ncbi:MAG: hypothetical protein WJU30_00096 [Candidatus Phytoplasma pruni]
MNSKLKEILIFTSTMILIFIVSLCISKTFFEKSYKEQYKTDQIDFPSKSLGQKIDGIQDKLDKTKNETQERFDKINKKLDKLIDEQEKNEENKEQNKPKGYE